MHPKYYLRSNMPISMRYVEDTSPIGVSVRRPWVGSRPESRAGRCTRDDCGVTRLESVVKGLDPPRSYSPDEPAKKKFDSPFKI